MNNNSDETRETDNKTPVWERTHEIKKSVSRGKWEEVFAAVIAISDHEPFYRYSVRCGVLRTKDGETNLFPFCNPFIKGQQFGTSVVDESLLIMADLLRQAHEWIVEDAQAEAEGWVKEQRGDKPKSKPVSMENVAPVRTVRRLAEHVSG